MTKPTDLQQAIQALHIDVPITRTETTRTGLRIWLYGRAEPVLWIKPKIRKETP